LQKLVLVDQAQTMKQFAAFFSVFAIGSATSSKGGLASTTFYDGSGDAYLDQGAASACECKTSRPGADVLHRYLNAAVSDSMGGGNPGSACRSCYQLTLTGKRSDNPEWSGNCPAGLSMTAVATNWCPARDNSEWCTSPNRHGYYAHFDLDLSWVHQDIRGSNCEVQYQETSCPWEVVDACNQNCIGWENTENSTSPSLAV